MTPLVPFGQALRDVSAGNRKIPQREFLADGPLAVVDQGRSDVAGYTETVDAAVKAQSPVIVFGDHTRAVKYVDFPFAMGADGVKVLQVLDGFDPKFVYRYLQFRELPSAGYSRHFKFLKELSVPKPALAEQIRIAAILDRADALRAKRRQVLSHLDALAPSIFHQMFSGAAFDHAPLGELMDVRSSLVTPDPESMGDLPHVGPDSLMSGKGSIAGWRTVAEDGVTSGKYRFQAGDVLYSKIRPNLNKVATASFSGLCSADMYALVPRASVATATYLEHLLRTPAFLGYADRLSNRANIPKLNRKQLESYMAPLPPIALQDDFARRIEAVGSTRQSVEAALVVNDEMFAALQSRAFRGEL